MGASVEPNRRQVKNEASRGEARRGEGEAHLAKLPPRPTALTGSVGIARG